MAIVREFKVGQKWHGVQTNGRKADRGRPQTREIIHILPGPRTIVRYKINGGPGGGSSWLADFQKWARTATLGSAPIGFDPILMGC